MSQPLSVQGKGGRGGKARGLGRAAAGVAEAFLRSKGVRLLITPPSGCSEHLQAPVFSSASVEWEGVRLPASLKDVWKQGGFGSSPVCIAGDAGLFARPCGRGRPSHHRPRHPGEQLKDTWLRCFAHCVSSSEVSEKWQRVDFGAIRSPRGAVSSPPLPAPLAPSPPLVCRDKCGTCTCLVRLEAGFSSISVSASLA